MNNQYIFEAQPEPLKGRMHEPLPQEISDRASSAIRSGARQDSRKRKRGQVQKAQQQKEPRTPQWQREQASAYQQLLVSLERLVDSIRSSKGKSNRELNRAAEQIDTITDELEHE